MFLLFSLALLTNLSFAQEVKVESCLPHQDLVEVSLKFTQLKQFLKKDKAEYCKKDLGKNWFLLAESLITLKNLKLNRYPYPIKDDLGVQVINDVNWWNYFVARANRFNFKQDMCKKIGTSEYLAYIELENPGAIVICNSFYEQNLAHRLAIFIHEVRHFDGPHTYHGKCVEKSKVDCDNAITDKGAYAIGIHLLVDLVLYSNLQFTVSEKQDIFGLIYFYSEQFNKPVKILVNDYLYLQNSLGEIWQWRIGSQDPIKMVHKLKEKGEMFLTTRNEINIFPENRSNLAYRMSVLNWDNLEAIGLFAKEYNKLSKQERGQLLYVNYHTSTRLYDKLLIVNCPINQNENYLTLTDFPEKLKTLIFLDNSKNLALGESGKIYEIQCPKNNSKKLQFQLSKSTAPQNIKRLFMRNDLYWALTDQGKLVQLEASGNNLIIKREVEFGTPNEDWIDMTLYSLPAIFEIMYSR